MTDPRPVHTTRNYFRQAAASPGVMAEALARLCTCVYSCSDGSDGRLGDYDSCSLFGRFHVHPQLGRCPVHPDAPGDWSAEELAKENIRIIVD